MYLLPQWWTLVVNFKSPMAHWCYQHPEFPDCVWTSFARTSVFLHSEHSPLLSQSSLSPIQPPSQQCTCRSITHRISWRLPDCCSFNGLLRPSIAGHVTRRKGLIMDCSGWLNTADSAWQNTVSSTPTGTLLVYGSHKEHHSWFCRTMINSRSSC